MLYFSLIASALLLLYANGMVRRSCYPGTTIACAGLTVLIGPFFMLCALPTVAIQALLMWIAVIVWRGTGRGPATFLRLSCGATVLAYGMGGILVYRAEQEYARLRALHPYQSMEDRVPEPRSRSGETLRPSADARLAALESRFTDHPNSMLERQLRLLHEDRVFLFVNSPGFGIGRMFLPAEWNLRFGLRREPVPAQPGAPDTPAWSPGEWKEAPPGEEVALGRLLEDSVFDFANSRAFGFLKDRRHVAGFESHRFGGIPGPAERWSVRRLELVSLLLHDEPAVYDSDHLPQMRETRDMPTRPLDRFERFGLDRLRRGEDLFIAKVGQEQLRMLGAVRSAKQCVACHGGGRGDLLGVFTYTLSRPPLPAVPGASSIGSAL